MHHETSSSLTCEPILRWAGGKRWLVPWIAGHREVHTASNFVEPFVGGGSVFFRLANGRPSVLADANSDLIQAYATVRTSPSEVSKALDAMQNTHEEYYKVRASRGADPIERAARFIYLNHTSFNGIYRVNQRGEYNVPYGNRANPKMPTKEHLESAAAALAESQIRCQDFEETLEPIGEGWFAFIDPPYTTAHNKNGFIKYNQRLFTIDDQRRLAKSITEFAARGGKYVLSNAAHESILEIFEALGEPETVERKSTISGKSTGRQRVEEFVFTNLDRT